jgi:hypothetical protein
MLRFSSLSKLNEALFSMSTINKILKIVQKYLEKKLGKIYRYDGDDGYQKLQGKSSKGIGILYFMKGGKAFRLIYSKPKGEKTASFNAVQIWKDIKFGKNEDTPDFTIQLNGMGIVNVLKHIVDIIKVPKIGEVMVTESMDLDLVEILFENDELYEGKQVNAQTFIKMVHDIYGERPDNLFTMAELKNVADHNQTALPGSIRKDMKGPRGKWDLGGGSGSGGGADTPSASTGGSGTLKPGEMVPGNKLVVIGRDSKNRFFNPTTDQVAKALEDELAKKMGIEGNPSKKEMEDPDTLFGHLADLVGMVARGTNPSLLIYGGAGTGKTFTVTHTLEKHGLSKGSTYFVVKGSTTPSGLYRTLYMHRNDLIVFDDSDSVFKDQDSKNLLKAALDSYDERVISWISTRTVNINKMDRIDKEEFLAALDDKLAKGEESKFPSSFEFTGKVIFISNLPVTSFENAILSRSFKIDMTLTVEQMFHRIGTLMREGNLGGDLPMEDKEEILIYLKERNALGKMTDPNLRSFVAAVSIRKSGHPNWKDLIQYS